MPRDSSPLYYILLDSGPLGGERKRANDLAHLGRCGGSTCFLVLCHLFSLSAFFVREGGEPELDKVLYLQQEDKEVITQELGISWAPKV